MKAAVDTLTTGRAELGVLDVKHFDALVIEVDVFEIVELLDHKVAGVEKDVAARVIVHALEEHFEGDAVVEIFARVDFEAKVDVGFVESVEDGAPPGGEFVEGSFDQARRALRPRVQIGPRQRAGKRSVRAQGEVGGGFGGESELLDGPGLAGFRVAADFRRGEAIEGDVVGGMYRD